MNIDIRDLFSLADKVDEELKTLEQQEEFKGMNREQIIDIVVDRLLDKKEKEDVDRI